MKPILIMLFILIIICLCIIVMGTTNDNDLRIGRHQSCAASISGIKYLFITDTTTGKTRVFMEQGLLTTNYKYVQTIINTGEDK
jgi:hypothetical protein